MDARRLVSTIKHKTGSLYRGRENEALPRIAVARALRRGRLGRRAFWTAGVNAFRMMNPAANIPTRLEYVPQWPVDRVNASGRNVFSR